MCIARAPCLLNKHAAETTTTTTTTTATTTTTTATTTTTTIAKQTGTSGPAIPGHDAAAACTQGRGARERLF